MGHVFPQRFPPDKACLNDHEYSLIFPGQPQRFSVPGTTLNLNREQRVGGVARPLSYCSLSLTWFIQFRFRGLVAPSGEREREGERKNGALGTLHVSAAKTPRLYCARRRLRRAPCTERFGVRGNLGPATEGRHTRGGGKGEGHRSQIPAPCAIPLCLSFNQHQPCRDLASILPFMSGDSDQWISLSPPGEEALRIRRLISRPCVRHNA